MSVKLKICNAYLPFSTNAPITSSEASSKLGIVCCTVKQWRFDEFWIFDPAKNGGPDFSSPEQVEAYNKKQKNNPAEERELLQKLGLNKDHTLIEVGAGTGTLVIEAAKRCKKVIAVDISEAMLSYIQKRADKQGLDNFELIRAGFLTYEHGGEAADFIVSKFALHHLPDFWKMEALYRMERMLKPGGTFYLRDVVFSFDPGETEETIAAWIDAVTVGSPENGWTREEFEAHVREEYSTYSWLLEPMLKKAGFTIAHKHYSELRTYASYKCTKAG